MDTEPTAAKTPALAYTGRKPFAFILVIGLLYGLISAPFALANLNANWRQVATGLALWSMGGLLIALPLSGLVGRLAARLERAETGLRHPKRAAWLGVSVGTLLVSHWLIHLAWSPMQMLWGLTGHREQEQHLIGGVLAIVAWMFAGAGLTLAIRTRRALTARSWENVTALRGPRRFPRLPTAWVIAAAYLCFSISPAIVLAALTADGYAPSVAVGLWTFTGLVAPVLVAAAAARLAGGLPHASPSIQPGARFLEQLGAIMVLHWAPFWLITLCWPVWRSPHTDQLFSAVYSGFLLVLCTAVWSVGRTYRSVPD